MFAAPITKGIERSSPPMRATKRLADTGDAQEGCKEQNGLDIRRREETLDRESADHDQRDEHDKTDERAATVNKNARHLECEDEDRFEHEEGDQITERAERRYGSRDDEIGEQKQRHCHDKHAVGGPNGACANKAPVRVRLAAFCIGGKPVLKGDCHIICKPKQRRDRDDGEEHHRLRQLPLRKADTEADRANDQGERQVQDRSATLSAVKASASWHQASTRRMAVDGDDRKAQQDEARDDSVTEGAKPAGGRLNDDDTHHDDESEKAGGGDEKQLLQRRKRKSPIGCASSAGGKMR